MDNSCLKFLLEGKLVEIMPQINILSGCLIFLLISRMMQNCESGIGLRPLDFFRFSEEDLGKEVKIIFHPDEGLRLREQFEKKYGTKGEVLIKSLGEKQVLTANYAKE